MPARMGWSWTSPASSVSSATPNLDPARCRSSSAAGAPPTTTTRGTRGSQMDLPIRTIEDARLRAYQSTLGAAATARVEIDRGSGHVTVWASEPAEDGAVAREYDDTPDGFGRIAATTARQVILQRLRDAEDELTFGEYAGRGDRE